MLNRPLFDLAKLKDQGGYKAGDLLSGDTKLYAKLLIHIGRTVKHDDTVKKMVFLTAISAYTPDPINYFLKGPPSTGKTYNVMEIVKYFPEDDVWLMGGLSPKAIIHLKGKLVDKNGEEINLEQKPIKPRKNHYEDKENYFAALEEYDAAIENWRKRLDDSFTLIDMSGKLLVFLETPPLETFRTLLPILSHDAKQISFLFTDKTSSGQLRTRNVVIKGWPATIFCTTEMKFLEALATRCFTSTPERSIEKYKEANILTGGKAAFPFKYEEDPDFDLLKGYIRFLRNNLQDIKIAVPYGEELGKVFPSRFPRSMRDFKHIMQLVKIHTSFHFSQRPVCIFEINGEKETYVLATAEDYSFIMGLWQQIRESTETFSSGEVMDFYHEIVEKMDKDRFSINDLVEKWNQKVEEKKGSQTIRKWVSFLCEINYMTKMSNPSDRRSNLFEVIEQKNIKCILFDLDAFFTLDSLKGWLNKARNIISPTDVTIKEKISSNEITLEQLYQKFFLFKPPSEEMIISTKKQASLSERTVEKTSFQKRMQFPLFSEDEVSKLERLTINIQDTCDICSFQGRMDWQVTLHDKTWGILCGDCGRKMAGKLEAVG